MCCDIQEERERIEGEGEGGKEREEGRGRKKGERGGIYTNSSQWLVTVVKVKRASCHQWPLSRHFKANWADPSGWIRD